MLPDKRSITFGLEKRDPLMRLTLLALVSACLLSGCFGAGPVTTKVRSLDIHESDRYPEKQCPSPESGHLEYCTTNMAPPNTQIQFRSIWGEPKSKGTSNEVEYWTYNGDLAWRGLVIFAIIPIPLLVPVGHNDVTLYFKRGKLTQITEEYGYGSYAICGLHSEGPDPVGCLIWH